MFAVSIHILVFVTIMTRHESDAEIRKINKCRSVLGNLKLTKKTYLQDQSAIKLQHNAYDSSKPCFPNRLDELWLPESSD